MERFFGSAREWSRLDTAGRRLKLMNRTAVTGTILALGLLGAVSTAFAHHPSRIERCELLTVSGQLERIEWTNPHVLLSIKTTDGESQQLGWLDVHSLTRLGIQPDTLHVGDRLIVEGGILPNDITDHPILVSSIRRPADGWAWSLPPQGC
jgi:hypothetical protein